MSTATRAGLRLRLYIRGDMMAKYKKGNMVRMIIFPWKGVKGKLVPNPEGCYDWSIKLDTGSMFRVDEHELERLYWWKFWQ